MTERRELETDQEVRTRVGWERQNRILVVILIILGALLGVFLTGLWGELAEIKNQTTATITDLTLLKQAIPKEYVPVAQYLAEQRRDQEFREWIKCSLDRMEKKMDAFFLQQNSKL